MDGLADTLRAIDGASYGAYKQLLGRWDLGELRLRFDHIQGDPFAAPSRLRVRTRHGLDATRLQDPDSRLACEDWLLRHLGRALAAAQDSAGRRGSGRSGQLQLYRPGPEILERSALRIYGEHLELRMQLGLPARGRRVLGQQAWLLLDQDLRQACAQPIDADALWAHVDSVRRQRALRRALPSAGLVCFIENGSVLPRASGVDPAPMPGALPFVSPARLQITLQTPLGPVTGMGIPVGVTVIVGGGFHGKSTLLQALAKGHLDHIPGDGRAGVVSLPDTVKIRAEDGRAVTDVDISCLLRDLPGGRSTRPFHSADASGSTSQAASLVEATQAGARVLLLDEDTCATNLMVRDARIRALVPREREPITPLVERVQQLHALWGLSLIIVVGGVGDYLGVADTVLSMEDFVCHERGAEAQALGIHVPPSEQPLLPPLERAVLPQGLAPGRIKGRDERRVLYGEQELELSGVEQILDAAQAWSIARALALIHQELTGPTPLPQLLDQVEALMDAGGVEVLSPRDYPDGGLVRPRRHEIAAALNRLRGLQVECQPT